MTSMNEPMKLLRTDGRGRVRTPVQRREALLDEYERSGASAAAFAKICGVNYQTFVGWVHRRRREREDGAVAAVPMVEVSVAEGPGERDAAVVVLELPGGGRVELRDAAQVPLVAALVRALAGGVGGAGGGRRC
jgi:transposase-like protein